MRKVLGISQEPEEDERHHQSRKLRSVDEDRVQLPPCPARPPGLLGSLLVRQSLDGPEPLPGSADFSDWFGDVREGGRFDPEECRAKRRVAVVIPYR